MIRRSLGTTRQSTYVNWVPLYHDMGLILNALEALYVGALCVLMAPNGFMQRPLNWLRAIVQYRAEVGCSPNFGYDLCVSRYRARPDAGHRSLVVEGPRSMVPSRFRPKPSSDLSRPSRVTDSIRPPRFRPMAWRRRPC